MCKLKLALALLAATSSAQAEFRQKSVQQFPLDDSRVPTAVRAPAAAVQWTDAERGPVPDLKLFARDPMGNVWLGGPEGAAQFDPDARHPWERWQFFAGPRWLKDNFVRNIVVDGTERLPRVWIRTDTGASLIEWRPTTLADKSAHF